MLSTFLALTAAAGMAAVATNPPGMQHMEPDGLRCEYEVDPLGVGVPTPRFSWIVRSSQHSQVQTAYQIIASSSPEPLAHNVGNLWDTGRVRSANTIAVRYAGRPLASRQIVHWKVRVWDADGHASKWSIPATFELGLLKQTDWHARWIEADQDLPTDEASLYQDRPAPIVRREFQVRAKPVRARLYVTGLGAYEVRINGKRVGDHLLDPGWTDFSRRVLTSTYDITRLIARGSNGVAATLGNGWYNPLPMRHWSWLNLREHLTIGQPCFLAQMVIDYADGHTDTIVTDGNWRWKPGPLLRNNIYLGEVYDARQEVAGSDCAGFDDSSWAHVRVAKGPGGTLEAQTIPPIRASRPIRARAITQPLPGVYVFDMGGNMAGVATLRVTGPAGTRITMRYGELLHPEGTLNPLTSAAGQIKLGRFSAGPGAPASAFQSDTYILKGTGTETYTPRFTYHGFRYVEVTGLPSPPTADTVTAHTVHTAVEAIGTFACSDPLLNKIQQMCLRTFNSNLHGVQSDCPHRERYGYGGDMIATCGALMMNLDMGRFYTKTVRDYADAARPDGALTETAPFVGIADAGFGGGSGPIGWATVHPVLQWQLYRFTGDRNLLEEQYPTTQRWLAFLQKHVPNYLLNNCIGDHESIADKRVELTSTAFYYENAVLAAKIAEVLGKQVDAHEYRALAARIRDAFNERFLDRATGRYDTGTQACQAFALETGLAPSEYRARALDALIREVQGPGTGHLNTGIFGTRNLLMCLAHSNRNDVAYGIVSQKTFPGWGYMLANGATTLWEHWALSEDTFSHNHPMFGSVSEWFYAGLAGISPADDACAFDRFNLHPSGFSQLRWVRASYQSVRGTIVSEWERSGNTVKLHFVVPANTTAVLALDDIDPTTLRENGRPVSASRSIRLLTRRQGNVRCILASGEYRFAAALQPSAR